MRTKTPVLALKCASGYATGNLSMALLDDIPAGAKVGLDSAAIIYFIEAHPDFGPIVRPFFEDWLDQGLNEAVTSTVSLTEVLVQHH